MAGKRDSLAMLAALSAAIAVAAGAYGAHGAAGKAAEWLRTGAMYQLVHAVAVLSLGRGGTARALLLLGSAIFAGTLYAMAFGLPRWLGAVTPIGGGLMIIGWLWLALRGR